MACVQFTYHSESTLALGQATTSNNNKTLFFFKCNNNNAVLDEQGPAMLIFLQTHHWVMFVAHCIVRLPIFPANRLVLCLLYKISRFKPTLLVRHWRKSVCISDTETRSCGRFGPDTDVTIVDRSSVITCQVPNNKYNKNKKYISPCYTRLLCFNVPLCSLGPAFHPNSRVAAWWPSDTARSNEYAPPIGLRETNQSVPYSISILLHRSNSLVCRK